jgi:hypothetical protein
LLLRARGWAFLLPGRLLNCLAAGCGSGARREAAGHSVSHCHWMCMLKALVIDDEPDVIESIEICFNLRWLSA